MALFEKAAPEQEAEEESQHVVAAKRRTKLFPYDSVAAQLLEPHGTSSVDKMSLAELWASTAKGNKRAMYHSHLAADQEEDAWHVGAGRNQYDCGFSAARLHRYQRREHDPVDASGTPSKSHDGDHGS